jgi:hypothetical protein
LPDLVYGEGGGDAMRMSFLILLMLGIAQTYHAAMDQTTLGRVTVAKQGVREGDTVTAMTAVIQPTYSEESALNHKLVMEIRLQDDAIDEAEKAVLRAIASKCEMLGGKAVAIARSMLATEGEMIWEDPSCDGYSKTAFVPEPLGPLVTAKCWPNPANDRLFFDFMPVNASGRVEVMDARGILVASRSFQDQESTLEVNFGALSQGIYLARASLTDGSLFTWKIIIQR